MELRGQFFSLYTHRTQSIDIFTAVVFGSPLPCLLSDGTLCPPLLCPNTSITLICSLPPTSPLQGYTIWKLPNGTCSSGRLSPIVNQVAFLQDILLSCTDVMPASCGGYRGHMELACRTSTLSVMGPMEVK